MLPLRQGVLCFSFLRWVHTFEHPGCINQIIGYRYVMHPHADSDLGQYALKPSIWIVQSKEALGMTILRFRKFRYGQLKICVIPAKAAQHSSVLLFWICLGDLKQSDVHNSAWSSLKCSNSYFLSSLVQRGHGFIITIMKLPVGNEAPGSIEWRMSTPNQNARI